MSACGGVGAEDKVDPEKAAPDDTGTVKQPIINGWALSLEDENYTGLLKMEIWSNTFQTYDVRCSATLMANGWGYTAGHCFDEDNTAGRRPWVSMGSQRALMSKVWRAPQDDFAIFTLETPLDMWNWTGTSHATNPPQINNWQYTRAIYSGTIESLNNQNVVCAGAGPGGIGAQQKIALLNMRWEPTGPNPQNQLHTYLISGFDQIQEPGDSGGGCFGGWTLHAAPLLMTETSCYWPHFWFCAGIRPQVMTTLQWGVVFGMPPTIVY